MAKKAFLVKAEFWTRIVVDETATEDEKLDAARPQIKSLAQSELPDHVNSIEEDTEMPYSEGELNPYTNEPY